MTEQPLYLRTDPAAPRGTRTISGACTLSYGHASCDPGGLVLALSTGPTEILPRSCWCRCHDDKETT
ncbi:hypothetical protein ACIQRS_26580 [Streptomyces termitum]|uniref:Uncharacterized protein n=1 Tax=Streptomyces termitum TaxID=67368 RepID=A0A918T6F7_9ACTN|nr:hypothetical protein [Streptomyces termitum]GHB01722.1 hypothetical protein GCM10010305_51210 [Streptomyces termitum]